MGRSKLNRPLLLWRASVLASLLLSVCNCSEPETPPPQSGGTRLYPTSEAHNATTVFLTGPVVTTRIHSGRIISYSDQDSAWAFSLNVDFYDRTGNHTSALRADSALIREKSRLMEGFGNVSIVTDDGRTLDSPHLAWNDSTRMITTDSLVRLTRGQDVMTGYGFSSDPELRRIRLRRQVSGRLTEPEALNDSL